MEKINNNNNNSEINLLVGTTGINDTYIKYDLELSNFISLFFSVIKDNNLDLILHGGTALNRGFFGEKQRLSVDIDLETKSNKKIIINKIINALKNKGITSEVPANINGLIIAHTKNESRIRIEISERKFDVKTQKIDLIPLTNYLQFTSLITYDVISYPLEYLMARKLNALSRRLIYKDIYDTYIGLNIIKEGPFKKYVKLIEKEYNFVEAAVYYLKKGTFEKNDAFDYKFHTQLKYRKSEEFMTNEIVNKIEKIFNL